MLPPLPALLAWCSLGTRTSVKGMKQEYRKLAHSLLSIKVPFLLLRPEVEDFSGAFLGASGVHCQLLSPG